MHLVKDCSPVWRVSPYRPARIFDFIPKNWETELYFHVYQRAAEVWSLFRLERKNNPIFQNNRPTCGWFLCVCAENSVLECISKGKSIPILNAFLQNKALGHASFKPFAIQQKYFFQVYPLYFHTNGKKMIFETHISDIITLHNTSENCYKNSQCCEEVKATSKIIVHCTNP